MGSDYQTTHRMANKIRAWKILTVFEQENVSTFGAFLKMKKKKKIQWNFVSIMIAQMRAVVSHSQE